MNWDAFAKAAPHIAEVFERRYTAVGKLCFLGTIRPDGFPRVSPMEPAFYEGNLIIGGMPGTAKFRDLDVDPRFSLHTATVDTRVSEGDAKVWGTVAHDPDPGLHARYAEDLYATTGFDLRGRTFDRFLIADIVGAASVEIDGGLVITTWKGGAERRIVKRD